MPDPYPELEIGLHRAQAESYQLELRFIDPASDAELAPVRTACALDPIELLPLQLEPEQYGQTLAGQVFSETDAIACLGKVKASVETGDRTLRLRLLIGPTAPELHSLRWELLCDPETRRPLATSERILFSRFLLSQDWRPIRLRPKTDLRALVAGAAPNDIDRYKLATVDLDGEVARVGAALQGIPTQVVGQQQPLTVDALTEALRAGVDILYLVAHGTLNRARGPALFLQDADGRTKTILGDDLAQRIAELREPPRLVVLASCESAAVVDPDLDRVPGTDPSPQAALAPRLAAAGVPAVIAMQGQVSMQTIAEAMPSFFSELVEDGQIDRALAVARGRVRDRDDAWMPALFMRLRGGRLWYRPGFGCGDSADGDAVKWTSLVNDIERKRFTPIIGWGLGEAIYGSTRDLAERLARSNRFPLAPYQQSDLPQVSDYLFVAQRNFNFPLDKVKDELAAGIIARHRELTGLQTHAGKLARLIREAAKHHAQDPQDPYRLAAELPAPVFINATPDSLLVEALRAIGKEPVVRHLIWRPGQQPPEPYEGPPTVAAPLVYHILGRFKDPASVVLTQDDHFDFLIGASGNRALIPKLVRHALSSRTLLLLGFQLNDWSFRVLYRLIRSQAGQAQGRNLRFPHAAVQLDPEANQLVDPREARRYLTERYGGDDVSLYWGGPDDFLRDPAPRLPRRTPGEWDALDEEGDDDDY